MCAMSITAEVLIEANIIFTQLPDRAANMTMKNMDCA